MREKPGGMSAFVLVWVGQVFSMVRSQMPHFAVGIWAWERTGQNTSLAMAAAGPLADRMFQPAMAESAHRLPRFPGPVSGTDSGSWMSVLIFLSGILVLCIGMSAYRVKMIKEVETRIPDHEEGVIE